MNNRISNNQKYNAERKAQAELMKRDIERDEILAKLYQKSYDRIQHHIDKFYLAYANKEGLTRQEAIKRASQMDVTKFNVAAAKAVKEKDFNDETNSWLRVYNLKMKVSRMELLKAELGMEIQNLTAKTNDLFNKARHDEYLNEYERQAGILGNSATHSKKRMDAILDADFYGQNFSSRVWGKNGLQATLQKDVFISLNRIFTDMDGYKKEMRLLAKKFGTSTYNAQRLLKTEIARINADTQLDMLKENDFTHLIYVAESGACELCGKLDGKAIPIKHAEKGVNMYPMHPSCRCSAYGHIELEYKAGGSTLDEYDVQEHGIESMFSDIEVMWNKISEGKLSKSDLLSALKERYFLGELSDTIAKLVDSKVVYIDKSSLASSLERHGKEYTIKEFKLIEKIVTNPYLVLDNSDRVKGSLLLYTKIPGKDKVMMEAVAVPDGDMLMIHFSKVGVRQEKKNRRNKKILYENK